MKKILLLSLLVTNAHASFFAGLDASVDNVNTSLRIYGDSTVPAPYSERVSQAKKNAFGVSGKAGYRFNVHNTFYDTHVGYGQLMYSAEQTGFDFNGKVVAPFATAGGKVLTLKSNASHDFVFGMAFGMTFNKVSALLGLNVHSTQFSVQLKNTSAASAAEQNATVKADQKKFLIGFEPTLGMEYLIGKVSLVGSVGYTVYNDFKTKRLYQDNTSPVESAFLRIKPRVLTGRIGVRFHF